MSSGFFSLGGGGKDPRENNLGTSNNNNNNGNNNNNNGNLFLFKNDEIYNKGFELWQQYYQLHQQRSVHHPPAAAGMVDFVVAEGKGGDGEQGPSFRVMRQPQQQVGGGGGGVNCQDCGNQAKKDCAHLRCRTCCRSRGFPCQTHVKSTWVPAAKRRERQQQSQQQLGLMRSSSSSDHHHHHHHHPLQIKRQRDDSSSSSPLPITRIPTTSSSALDFPGGQFPSELNSPAVFRCVKVSAMDDEVDQYAYQTAVSIGGHVFKGILYDQGPEAAAKSSGGEGSSAAGHQQAASAALLDPSVYPTPFNAFMAGTQSFPPPRP